jgi:ABC-type multidrug transport system fused ATPase/permease subunit
MKIFLREWKKEEIAFQEEERRKQFKKRLLSQESMFTLLLKTESNDLFEEFFNAFLSVAELNIFEKCNDSKEKINRFEEIEKHEKEGQIFTEEEKIEKEKLEEQIDNILSDLCQNMKLFYQELEENEKKEEQIQMELEKAQRNLEDSEEEYVDEFELAYQKRKARQKVFDYITWGLFCFSFLASLCWMFIWKMTYDEYLIFISYFWVSIWTVIGINYYQLKDQDQLTPTPYESKRYIASIFEKIADLFDKNKEDPYWRR